MYRSYTKIFRIFGAMIIFLQISKDLVLFTNSENKNFHCSSSSLALTTWARCQRHRDRARRRCCQLRPAKRVGGASPVRRTVPPCSTPRRESNPILRTTEDSRERAPRRPWRLGHGGARRNHGDDAVENKAK